MLEYIPGGSLEDQEGITAAECVSITGQCTSALAYLHGHDPPIVHRDIKPSNIFIQVRDVGHIHVKFGDFGLSKDYDNLSTICGSWRYLAPEMYQNRQYIGAGGKQRVTYTAAVDIWSLGIVVYELLCDLPPYRQKYECSGTVWCEEIIKMFQKDFENGPDQLRRFLLETMVVLRPIMRWSAQNCYTRAELLAAPKERSETRRTALYAGEDQQMTIPYQAEQSTVNGKQTVIQRPNSYGRASALSKANAPPPQSSALASSSRLSEGWEQDCNVLSGCLLEQLISQVKPGNEELDEHPQTSNSLDGQEAVDAELLLHEFSQHAYTGSQIGSVTLLSHKLGANFPIIRYIPSESGLLSRLSPPEIGFIPQTGSIQTNYRRSQRDMENTSDVWRETSRYNAQLLSSIEPTSPSPRGRDNRQHKPTVRQHPESESEVEYYEKCWLDPLHPLGRGSSLTMSGYPADNSGASALTLERSMPQDLVEPIDGQDLMKQPSNVTSPDQHSAAGGKSIQSWRSKRTVQGAWTDSKQCLAPATLQPMHEDRSNFSRLHALFHDNGCATDYSHPIDDRYPMGGDRGEHSVRKKDAAFIEQKEVAQSPGITSPRCLILPNSPENNPVCRKKRTRYCTYFSYCRPRMLT